MRNVLFFEERDAQISELNTRYETKEKEYQIQMQKISIEKKDSEIKQSRIVTLFSIIMLVLFFVFITYRHRVHLKLNNARDEMGVDTDKEAPFQAWRRRSN